MICNSPVPGTVIHDIHPPVPSTQLMISLWLCFKERYNPDFQTNADPCLHKTLLLDPLPTWRNLPRNVSETWTRRNIAKIETTRLTR